MSANEQKKTGKAAASMEPADAGSAANAAAGAETSNAAAEMEKLHAELKAEKAKNAEAEKAKAEAEKKLTEMIKEADDQTAKEEAELARQIRAQRKVRIVIPAGKGENERFPVPVAINGHPYLIERDKEVDVPEAVCNVLDLAVESIPVTVGEGLNRRVEIHSAPAYPYIRKGYIDPKTGELGRGA